MESITIRIDLEINGAADDAQHVVDSLLDAGFFQDAINDHDIEGCGTLHVTSATCRIAESPRDGDDGSRI